MSIKTSENKQSKSMQFEAKKTYLKRYTKMRVKIDRLSERLGDLDSSVDKVLYDETTRRISAMQHDAQMVRTEILSVIDALEIYNELEVIEMYFIDNMTFEEIADEKCYSVRHVIRLYSGGINKLVI